MRLFTLIIYFVCATTTLFSQTLTYKQEKAIHQIVCPQFGEIGVFKPPNLGSEMFCNIEKDTFYNISGYHFLFRLKGDTLERIDKCIYHGANFGRYLFTWNKTIYALGGYGFFTTNNNLEYFNSLTKEWSFQPTRGDVPSYIHGLALKTDHYLYSFYNSKGGNAATEDISNTDIYRLDLDSMTWKKFPNLNKEILQLKLSIVFYLRDYVFLVASPNLILINKKELKYVQVNIKYVSLIYKGVNFKIDSNKLFYTYVGNSSQNPLQLELNIDSLWAEFKSNSQSFILEPKEPKKKRNSNLVLFMASGMILPLAALAFLYQRRKKLKTATVDSPSEIIIEELPIQTEIIENLINSSKNVLTTDELDYILKIGHLEQDSRKLRRHRLLSEIQKNHPTLITRIKDVADRRRFLYKVETKV